MVAYPVDFFHHWLQLSRSLGEQILELLQTGCSSTGRTLQITDYGRVMRNTKLVGCEIQKPLCYSKAHQSISDNKQMHKYGTQDSGIGILG